MEKIEETFSPESDQGLRSIPEEEPFGLIPEGLNSTEPPAEASSQSHLPEVPESSPPAPERIFEEIQVGKFKVRLHLPPKFVEQALSANQEDRLKMADEAAVQALKKFSQLTSPPLPIRFPPGVNCVPSFLKGWIRQRVKWPHNGSKESQKGHWSEKPAQLVREDYKTLFNSGSVFLQQGNHQEALSCFQEAARLKPDHEETYHALGQVYERMGRFGSAKQMYRQVLEIDPGNIEALIRTAHILEREGDYHQAVRVYQKAIEINPQAVAPRFGLALLYQHYDMFDEAKETYEALLEKEPSHPVARFNLGRLLFQLGEYHEAHSLP